MINNKFHLVKIYKKRDTFTINFTGGERKVDQSKGQVHETEKKERKIQFATSAPCYNSRLTSFLRRKKKGENFILVVYVCVCMSVSIKGKYIYKKRKPKK